MRDERPASPIQHARKFMKVSRAPFAAMCATTWIAFPSFAQSPPQASQVRPTIASPKLVSVSPNSTLPLGLVTISGADFLISAKLDVALSDRLQYSVKLPVVSASTSSVQISIPPYITASGAPGRHVVTVQLQETLSDGSQLASNKLLLQIQAPPPRPKIQAGVYTLALLQAVLAGDIDLQSSLLGTAVGTDAVLTALDGSVASLQTLAANVQAVVDKKEASFVIGTRDGEPLLVNAAVLAESDRLVLALLKNLAGPPPQALDAPDQMRTSSAASSSYNQVQLAAQGTLSATDPNTVSQNMAKLFVVLGTILPPSVPYVAALAGGETAAEAAVVALPVSVPIASAAAVGYAGYYVFSHHAEFENTLKNLKEWSMLTIKFAKAECDIVHKGVLKAVLDELKSEAISIKMDGVDIQESFKVAIDGVKLSKCLIDILSKNGAYNANCELTTFPARQCSGGTTKFNVFFEKFFGSKMPDDACSAADVTAKGSNIEFSPNNDCSTRLSTQSGFTVYQTGTVSGCDGMNQNAGLLCPFVLQSSSAAATVSSNALRPRR